MARAAAVLAAVVCCLLVAPAPARHPVDLPRQVPDAVDPEAAAKPHLPRPCADAEAVDTATALAVPEVSPAGQRPSRSSLLCLVFRCRGEVEDAGGVVRGSEEPPALAGWTRPAGKAEVEDDEEGAVEAGQERPEESDSDSDSDCDSDDEDEGGIVGWFWSLVDRF